MLNDEIEKKTFNLKKDKKKTKINLVNPQNLFPGS
jgi:hypothetical protein